MKKNDVFTFTAPNGVEVTAVAIEVIGWYHEADDAWQREFLCYAQNRLFRGTEDYIYKNGKEVFINFSVDWVIVGYCIIPEYDKMLEDYQHQLDIANDYADKTL